MEELRQQDSFCNIPASNPLKNHPSSPDQNEAEGGPITLSTYLATFKETKIQIFNSSDRIKWLGYMLRQLSESDLPDKELIEQYLRHMYRRMCKATSVENAYQAIICFVHFLQNTSTRSLKEISRDDLEAFIEHEQDRGLKITTVKAKLVLLRAFIRFHIDKGELPHELLGRRIMIKLPDTLPRAIDPQDLKRLLAAIDNIRDRALLLLLLRTGMRIGELLSTKMVDLHMTDKKIMIYQAMKTGTGRVVYYSDDARVALDDWLKQRDKKVQLLFYVRRGRMMSYGCAREIFMKYVHKAGLSDKGYSLHRLRHTFASELLNAGMRLECLQKLLGHTSVEVTRRYARLTDKTREEEYFKAMERIERGDLDGHY